MSLRVKIAMVAGKSNICMLLQVTLVVTASLFAGGCPDRNPPDAEQKEQTGFAGASPYTVQAEAGLTRDREAERDELKQQLKLQEMDVDLSPPEQLLSPAQVVPGTPRVCAGAG